MPLPHWIARANKRLTNRFIEPVVRHSRHYAVIGHDGRASGRRYQTPVFVFWRDNTGFVALTYGVDADWVRNVLRSGGTLDDRRGRRGVLTAVTVVGRDEAWTLVSRRIRFFLTVLRVQRFVRFELGPVPAA